ncbi:hypothetical protein B0A52_09032 [Exophiala mesophila]|uniref:Transcription factor domain-containing protein n=1 Tax=Exophiala mesophila TaxID=212818 RepID=A0A438MTC0_EXOME|nr:hypothetical protein B0A52_09032 [Exophiala mesophila]
MRLAMLLGLYQIIIANNAEPGKHDVHAKGLAALTDMGNNSPLYLLRTVRQKGLKTTRNATVGQTPSKQPTTIEKPQKIAALFSVPAVNRPDESLDDLLLSLNDLWERGNSCSTLQDYLLIKDQCNAMDQRLTRWQTSRRPEFCSTTISSVPRTQKQDKNEVGYWPGNVDTYFDLYIAHVWNVFRTARLLLIALMHRVWQACEMSADVERLSETATSIAEDMISSIPFHLVESLPDFIKDLSTSEQIKHPGRAIGGLLLTHPLHIASNLAFLPEPTKQYMRDCLSWIGSCMGIGHASVLAEAREINHDSLMSAIVIVWSGFLG